MRHLPRRRLSALLFAALPLAAAAQPADTATTELARSAAAQAQAYRRQQSARLAAATDRDSLIAAVLLALPADVEHAPDDAAAAPLQRLQQRYPDDPLALYTAALVCHLRPDCSDAGAATRLQARAPANAVHWLLQPAMGRPTAAQLQQAAAAGGAQPHLGEFVAIVGRVLDGQPAPQAEHDPAALAAQLRVDAIDALPQPRFAAMLQACKDAAAAKDCRTLGQRLLHDAQGSILSRMIGSTLLRRLAKGGAEETAARAFRRDYVWLGGHELGRGSTEGRARLQRDLAAYGEWQALQRAASAAGIAASAPEGWMPADPQQLLLPEERQPASR
ncbi:hypothetical protein [Tahibacter harae]|uniref:Uncharacterized protein n=1 Tax=Tahibacter harae TaxID=2963937 RepID=A0ABT1QNV8_9GAMM|nr:hypothetical protein [Tahibacter harae]MCQ4163322.1 hypothetical protein [Tahibacter harae]